MRSLKSSLRSLLEKTAPNLTQVVQAVRARRHLNRMQTEWGLAPITDRTIERLGRRVLAGPFKGVEFDRRTTWSCQVAKIVGSYELELTPDFERLLSPPRGDQYDLALDVGCADGYYAIGMALRLPRARVVAFDIDPLARKVVREMSKAHGVDARVDVQGACTPELMEKIVAGRKALVLSDCEGYEAVLIDPQAVPSLRLCDVVIELHEEESPGIRKTIQSRFEDTHDIKIIDRSGRNVADYADLAFLGPADAERMIVEVRSATQQWAVLTTRAW